MIITVSASSNQGLFHIQWIYYPALWKRRLISLCYSHIVVMDTTLPPFWGYNLFTDEMYLATSPSMQDPLDLCPSPSEFSWNITQYQIRFQTGSVVATENVNIAECTVGRCSHTFDPPSNPPSSYDSVSVAAENVVGVGAARACTTQTISKLTSSLCKCWVYC